MAQLTGLGTVALQLEKVHREVPVLFEREDKGLYSMIKKSGRTDKSSTRPTRLPLLMGPGGKFGGYNPEGGDMGLGSGDVYDFGQVTPIFQRMAVQFTQLSQYATDSDDKAVKDAVNQQIANSLKQAGVALDQAVQGAGQGVLGTVSSVSGATATMQVPNGAVGVYDGEDLNILNSTLTTQRNLGGPVTVQNHDMVGGTVVFTANLPGTVVNGDVLTDPFITPNNTVGLFGIKYHHNNATSGIWLTLNRATYPFQLRTPSINGNNNSLIQPMIRQGRNKIRKTLGADVIETENFIAYMNTDQEMAYEQLGLNMESIVKEGAGGKANDLELLFTGKLTMAGMPIKCSIHADQTRIDFIALKHWGRVVSKELGFFKDYEGKMIFPTYGASGGINASWLFYYDIGHQIWDDNPLMGCYLFSLAVPQIF